jgi:hypothetical protein
MNGVLDVIRHTVEFRLKARHEVIRPVFEEHDETEGKEDKKQEPK